MKFDTLSLERSVRLKIPLGYRIIDKVKNVGLDEAERILKSKKQKRYIKATRRDLNAELLRRYLVCPYCDTHISIDSGLFFRGSVHYRDEFHRRLTKNHIKDWSSMQLSFFEDANNKIINICTPKEIPANFKCSVCNNESFFSEEFRNVEIVADNQSISIKSEILDISEFFSSYRSDSEVEDICFPMYETLTFDIEKGKIKSGFECADGKLMESIDITGNPEFMAGSVTDNLIARNKVVRRTLKRMFKFLRGGDLPYSESEITLKTLFKLTTFVGYDRNFYDSIPYNLSSMTIGEPFAIIASELHNSSDADKIYKKSGLPDVKSVRRIFFANPGMLFYVAEADKVWRVINDLNLFCKLLKLPNIFVFLSDLNMRPGIIEYIKDYCRIKGARSFVKNVEFDWENIREAAIDYVGMSDYLRKLVQKNLTNNNRIGRIVMRMEVYSLPAVNEEKCISDCVIDGYQFFVLKNSNEYIHAGERLDNCLSSRYPKNTAVVCMKKFEEYVAAIEISNGMILQAKGYKNSCIDSNPDVFEVFCKWKEKFNLEWYEDYYADFLEIYDD